MGPKTEGKANKGSKQKQPSPQPIIKAETNEESSQTHYSSELFLQLTYNNIEDCFSYIFVMSMNL